MDEDQALRGHVTLISDIFLLRTALTGKKFRLHTVTQLK
jgi:hypothetical protein